jgi:hypothetical protein
VSEMKQFVHKLPHIQAAKHSLANRKFTHSCSRVTSGASLERFCPFQIRVSPS